MNINTVTKVTLCLLIKTSTALYLCPLIHGQIMFVHTVTYSQNCQGSNLIGTVVHLIVSPAQDLCSTPRYKSKGHHVPLGGCDCQGLSPMLGRAIGELVLGCEQSRCCPPATSMATADGGGLITASNCGLVKYGGHGGPRWRPRLLLGCLFEYLEST